MRLFSELFENRVPVKNKCIIKDKGAGHSSRRPGASYRKLRLESLEERQLLAVCTIDSANDTVVMSAAMIAENSVPSMEAELPLAVSAALSTPTVNYGGDKADTSFDLSVDYIDEAGTYTVQYKKSDELSWTTFSSNSYDTDYTVTGLTAGTAYNFRVKANAYGSYTESGWGTYNGTTGIKLDTPTGLQVDSTTSNSITISWNAVDDAVRYRVYYKYGSYETGKYVDATTYTITGLSTGTSYTITVIALGAQNTYADETATYTNSDRSTPVTVTIKTPLASTVVSFEDKTDTSVKIKWGTVTDAQAYTVEYKLSSAADLNWTSLGSGFTAPALNIAGLNPETTYDFRVKANATDSYNESEWSTVLAVKTGIKLDTPTGLNVDAKTDTSVTFHWTEVENASGYIISYEDLSEVVAQDTSSITLNDLDSDKSYSFYVQAIGEGGKDAGLTHTQCSRLMISERYSLLSATLH